VERTAVIEVVLADIGSMTAAVVCSAFSSSAAPSVVLAAAELDV